MFGIRVAGPNMALIRSGGGDPKVVVGGRMIVLPIIHREQRLSLEVMTLLVETTQVYTQEGVAVSVDGVAQVKVARSDEAIRTAAQQFLGKRPDEIQNVILQTMEGHQRAILGTMTVEAIYQDRAAFADQVREVAATDMVNMGMEIVSFTIRNISDEQGYLDALGVRRTSQVKRDATVGQAEAERDAGIRSAAADRDGQAARFQADTAIAESERDFATQKAQYDQQVNARRAEAELAYALQEAKTRQQIRQEEVQIEVVERQRQIEVQEQEVKRRELELEATIRRPVEAERYRLETLAEGNRARVVAEASGEAEGVRLRGQAEADAIRARGLAEAEAMRVKAEAWKEYGQAAMIQQLLESLPQVAAAVAQPLSKTERIVMISGGGSGDSGGVGASRLTRDITNIIAQLPAAVEALTGIDLLGSLKNLPGVLTTEGRGAEQPAPEAQAPEPEASAEEGAPPEPSE